MKPGGSSGPIVSGISARPSPSSSAQPHSPKPRDIIPKSGFGWGYATISLHTKKIKGLHENDFIMAAKLDRIAAEARRRRPKGAPDPPPPA